MNNNKEAFKSLSNNFFTQLTEAVGGKNNNSAIIRVFLLLTGILIFVGKEVVKVLFRKNFGKEGISLSEIVVSFIYFCVISYFSYTAYEEYIPIDSQKLVNQELNQYGSRVSYLIFSLFYGILGIVVLVKGILAEKNASTKPNEIYYEGDSVVFAFLIRKKGWKQVKVRKIAEPISIILVGAVITPINLLMGIPLAFCGLSVWLFFLFDKNKESSISDQIVKKAINEREDEFVEIIYYDSADMSKESIWNNEGGGIDNNGKSNLLKIKEKYLDFKVNIGRDKFFISRIEYIMSNLYTAIDKNNHYNSILLNYSVQKIQYKNSDNNDCFSFILIEKAKVQDFKKTMENGNISLPDWGIILLNGYGNNPSEREEEFIKYIFST